MKIMSVDVWIMLNVIFLEIFEAVLSESFAHVKP